MTEFTGTNLVVQWIWSGGTVAISGDYRSVNWQPSVGYSDVTAGSDTHVGRLTNLKDSKASITMVDSSPGTATSIAACAGQPRAAG